MFLALRLRALFLLFALNEGIFWLPVLTSKFLEDALGNRPQSQSAYMIGLGWFIAFCAILTFSNGDFQSAEFACMLYVMIGVINAYGRTWSMRRQMSK